MRTFTEEQAEAIARREGPLLLAAGAGSGKTSVLVERFARSVLDDGLRPAQILAITFTEKAAGELRARVRERFLALGERDAARETESAWIGTIHGFCTRVLRGHAVAAGLDPAFVVLDDTVGRELRARAWRRAYATWIDAGGDAAVDVAAAYGVDRLAAAIGELHDALRSAGATRPALPPLPPVGSIAAARAAVERAVPAAQAELAAAKPGVRVAAAQEAVVARRGFSTYRMDALCGPGCTAYRDAVEAVQRAERDERATAVAEQLGALLDAFATAFAEEKAQRSGLDFDDLQLHARDLLRDDAALRASYAERFARVMVDEFQDTNPLQLELVDLLAPGGAFVVGDEQQSIYGFRHADVEVFRGRRAALAERGATATLTTNFRSRPEILAAVNAAFAPRFGDGFMALRPGRAVAPSPAPVVEVLVTDTEGWDEVDLGGLPPAQAWRHAEARLLAQRIAELVERGEAAPEDVVVLLRAVGSLPVFERALQDVGLPTLAVGGRGYWGRQVVRDLCGWLAVLANPRDEIALYGVLASPLVGASTDALALLGAPGPGHAWQRLADAFLTGRDTRLAERLAPEDRERLHAFAVRLADERAVAPRLGLDELLERIVEASGYDLHVLSLPNGERRLANVHKLQRLAAEHEREHGRDVRAFVDLANAELEAEAREADAPVELGDVRAVRLMTIHAAKGLEFGVVCVADLGRKVPADTDDLLVDGDRVGLRLVGMDGSSVQALAYPELRERAMTAASAEEARIAYVALTRAQERLIVSGSVSVAKWPDPTAQTAPPIAWLAPALVPGVAEAVADEPVREVAWRPQGGEEVRVRITLSSPAALGTALRRPAPAGAAEDLPVAATPVLGAPGAPAFAAPGPPATLSYSALRAYDECGYRFYLERVLGLPREKPPAPPPGAERPAALAGIDLLTRGSLVHELLEELDLATGGPWAPGGDPAERLARVHDVAARHELELTADEAADLDALVEVVARGELRARLAAAPTLQREYAFAFPLGPVTMNGFVDILAVEADGTALVVDYKSDLLEPGTDPEAYVEQGYALQRRLYALAALRTGAPRVEVVYALLDRPHEPVRTSYASDDVATLERDILALVAGPLSGEYRVTDRPHRELCSTCPGRRAMCSWPEEMTLRPAEDVLLQKQ
jgi:ATP-dependent exoDNAse (exonuclease V) beta subunit